MSPLAEMHARLRAEIADPRGGIYGPDSAMWKVGREAIAFLGGGRAIVLQLAHPYVAHGVAQHSRFQDDPLGRFQRTFTAVFAMVFGDLDEAIKYSRIVHAVHSRIHGAITEDVGRFRAGDPYTAADPGALMWVHATLLDTQIMVYELTVRRLSLAEKQAIYAESKRFAMLFGIPDDVVPPDWPAFERYMAAMLASDTIVIGDAAREQCRAIFAKRPIYQVLELITAGLLTPRLRRELGYDWTLARRAQYRAVIAATRAGLPLLPRALRDSPAYTHAQRRLAGRGPDPIARWLERLPAKLIGKPA